MKRLLGLIVIESFLLLALVAAAQEQRNVAKAAPSVNSPAAAATLPDPPAPKAAPAEFLAKYDKLQMMFELRELRRAKYEAADKDFVQQIEALASELRAQVPAGYQWNAAERAFVKVAAAPNPAGGPAPAPAQPAAKKPR
jgi:hypothetical protein